MSVEDYVSYKDAAKMAKCSVSAIVKWANEGTLTKHKIFGSRVVDRKQLNRLIEHQREHPFDWRKTWQKDVDEE